MLRDLKIVILAVLACAGWAHADNTLLYFQIVDSPVIVKLDGTTTSWDASDVSSQGYMIDSARVVVKGGGLGEETALTLGFVEAGQWVEDDDSISLDVANPPQERYALITDYASAEYSFAIELGCYVSGEWVTLASSASLTYQQLDTGAGPGGSYITIYDATVPAPQGQWAPETYNVPEPSSGLLMLIGVGLLALRRGRARAPRAPLGRRRR